MGTKESLCGHCILPTMASDKCIDNLSDELLLEIFSHFTTEQLAMTIQHVNCRWKEVSQDNSLWKNRDYSPGETTKDDEIIQHLRNMPMLRKFSPKRGIRNDRVIDTMCGSCRNIHQLEFTWNQYVKVCLIKQILIAFPDLTVLRVPLPKNMHFVEFFRIIGQFKNLIRLSFIECYKETYLKVLTILADGCPSLQHIDLNYCIFNDGDIRYFLEKKKYQLLSFSVRCYISPVTFITLSECTNLEYLVYNNYNVDIPDTYVHLFSKLSNLKNLSLSRYRGGQSNNMHNIFANNALPYLTTLNIYWCDDMEVETLNAILLNCSNIKELGIYDNRLEGGFESIETCNNLKKLTIGCKSIGDKSFEYIGAGCCQLKKLEIKHCDLVTDKAFEYICSGYPLLEQLIIYDICKITDGIFENLFKCKNLRYLNIQYNTNITGIHFDKIPTHLVHLRTLHIYCEKLNIQYLEKLQTKMPQLKIECERQVTTLY